MFVVSLEGPDFSGKSTLATALLMKLREKGLSVERTELPSRLVTGHFTDILRNSKDKVDPAVFALTYAADHLHHFNTMKGKKQADVLILERSSLSYFVYQGLVLGVNIDWLRELNKFNGMKPNLTVIVKTPYKELLRRKNIRLGSEDKFEEDAFLKKVNESFMNLPEWMVSEYNVKYFEYEDNSIIVNKIAELIKK
jgi:thymidylate kinase